jgi:hypothetical protein
LQSVTIGHAVQSIGNVVFKSCTGLKEVISHAATLPSLGENPFDGINLSGGTLSVPLDAVAAYKAANYWNNFGSIVPIFGIVFEQPAAFNNGQTEDITFTPAGDVKTITAVDIPQGWTVTPNLSAKKITVTAPANGGTPYTATGTVTLIVSDGAERTVTQPLALQCTAYAGWGINFTQPGLFDDNETKEIGFTLTGGATTVKVRDVPADWKIAVATSGSAGTFTVTAPATMDETNIGGGGALALVSDAAGNTVMRTLTVSGWPRPPLAATMQIWRFGDYVWSDRIIVPECNKEDWTADAQGRRCRSFNDEGTLRYYYNWEYTNRNRAEMCPSPWGLPTDGQLNNLKNAKTVQELTDAWGLGGQVNENGSMGNQDDGIVASGQAIYDWIDWPTNWYWFWVRLWYPPGGASVGYSPIGVGMQVRCVK